MAKSRDPQRNPQDVARANAAAQGENAPPREHTAMAGDASLDSRQKNGAAKGTDPSQGSDDVLTIKKYPNRRLYNTAESRYITLEDLAALVRSGVKMRVIDARSGNDLTRTTLAQIIFDNECKQSSLLPTEFLRQLICFYDDNMRLLLPEYLQQAITNFRRQQEDMRRLIMSNNPFGNFLDPSGWDALSQKQMDFIRDSVRFFLPNAGGTHNDSERIAQLEQQISDLRRKLQSAEKS